MVDLGLASTRKAAPASLKDLPPGRLVGGRAHISGPIGPPVSVPMEGFDTSNFPSLARPSTSASMKKEWASPLDKEVSSDSRPSTPKEASLRDGRSPLAQSTSAMDLRSLQLQGKKKADTSTSINGYPSPPSSIKNEERGLSPAAAEPKNMNRPNAPSALRRVNTAEPLTLPSPADSSDERFDAASIRSAMAKRDTMTFHSPRRKSFAKQMDDRRTEGEKLPRTAAEKEEIKRKRQTEGFEGNFSAFNFGRSAPADSSIPLPADAQSLRKASSDRAESPVDVARPSPSLEEKKDAKSRGMTESISSHGSGGHEGKEDAKPTLQPLQKPPPTGALPRPPTRTRQDSQSTLMDSRHIQNTPSLDSLRGPQRPRVDSDTRSPGTPTALRAPPPAFGDRADLRSLRSRSSTNSQKSDDLADAPPPALNHERRSQSPMARPPIAGDFPLVKGLPRGRRPGPPPPISVIPQNGEAPPRPPRTGDPTANPGWPDRNEKHNSAIPAPLSPLRDEAPRISPVRPHRPVDEDFSDWLSSAGAPRLPSPTFYSLEKSISSSSENLAKTFELASNTPAPPPLREMSKPLISPVLGEFALRNGDGTSSPASRINARKPPPRPNPVSLPPSQGGSRAATPDGSLRSPTAFGAGFI